MGFLPPNTVLSAWKSSFSHIVTIKITARTDSGIRSNTPPSSKTAANIKTLEKSGATRVACSFCSCAAPIGIPPKSGRSIFPTPSAIALTDNLRSCDHALPLQTRIESAIAAVERTTPPTGATVNPLNSSPRRRTACGKRLPPPEPVTAPRTEQGKGATPAR